METLAEVFTPHCETTRPQLKVSLLTCESMCASLSSVQGHMHLAEKARRVYIQPTICLPTVCPGTASAWRECPFLMCTKVPYGLVVGVCTHKYIHECVHEWQQQGPMYEAL